jgi:hypothetical protein
MWLTTSVGADEENELAEVWLEIALENVKKLSSFPDTEGVFDASRINLASDVTTPTPSTSQVQPLLTL